MGGLAADADSGWRSGQSRGTAVRSGAGCAPVGQDLPGVGMQTNLPRAALVALEAAAVGLGLVAALHVVADDVVAETALVDERVLSVHQTSGIRHHRGAVGKISLSDHRGREAQADR